MGEEKMLFSKTLGECKFVLLWQIYKIESHNELRIGARKEALRIIV